MEENEENCPKCLSDKKKIVCKECGYVYPEDEDEDWKHIFLFLFLCSIAIWLICTIFVWFDNSPKESLFDILRSQVRFLTALKIK